MATTEELLQQIAKLTAENQKLKQCGNCKQFNNYTDNCKLDPYQRFDFYSYMTCENWEWQGVGD